MTASRRDPHLGALVAAVADGALDHAARDRALAHLARCEQCRGEVDEQRRIKALMAGMSKPAPPPPGLAERLAAIPETTAKGANTNEILPADPCQARFRTVGRPAADKKERAAAVGPRRSDSERPLDGRPGHRTGPAGPGRGRRRRIAATAASGIAVFALTLATVAFVGGGEDPVPVTPQVGTFTVEHARVTGGLPGTEVDVGAVDVENSRR